MLRSCAHLSGRASALICFMRSISERETLNPHYTTTFLPVPDEPADGCGFIVGTIQYMSAKQIEGKDYARPDIVAFGGCSVRPTDEGASSL
jgi:hypothetical protein